MKLYNYLSVDLKVLRSYIRTNIRKGLYRSIKYKYCSNSIVKIVINRFIIYRNISIYNTGWLIRSFNLSILIDCLFKDDELSL